MASGSEIRAIWAASWQNQQNDLCTSEDSDQPVHLPSLIRVFAVCSLGSWGHNVSSCGQRRLWSDWAGAQADLESSLGAQAILLILSCSCRVFVCYALLCVIFLFLLVSWVGCGLWLWYSLDVFIPLYLSSVPLRLNFHGGHRRAVLRWRKARVILGNSVRNYPMKPPRLGRWQPTIHTYRQVFFLFVCFVASATRTCAAEVSSQSLRQPCCRLSYACTGTNEQSFDIVAKVKLM